MKIKTLLFSRLNIFSPSYIHVEESFVIVASPGQKETIPIEEIDFFEINTPKLGFSSIALVIGAEERKVLISGFNKRQCLKIATTVTINQLRKFEFHPRSQYTNLRIMRRLSKMLVAIANLKPLDPSLVKAIALRLEEGLEVVRKLRHEEWEKDIASEEFGVEENSR